MIIIWELLFFKIHVNLMKLHASSLVTINEALHLKISVSRLCFLPDRLPIRSTCEGLFPCFSADCLSGETRFKKVKFVNEDNTIEFKSWEGLLLLLLLLLLTDVSTTWAEVIFGVKLDTLLSGCRNVSQQQRQSLSELPSLEDWYNKWPFSERKSNNFKDE